MSVCVFTQWDQGPLLLHMYTAIWRCRKNLANNSAVFKRKLPSHWLKSLQQCHIDLMIQEPGDACRPHIVIFKWQLGKYLSVISFKIQDCSVDKMYLKISSANGHKESFAQGPIYSWWFRPVYNSIVEIQGLWSLTDYKQQYDLSPIHTMPRNCKIRCWIIVSLSNLTDGSISQIARFIGPTWGPPGSCRPQVGPMLAL